MLSCPRARLLAAFVAAGVLASCGARGTVTDAALADTPSPAGRVQSPGLPDGWRWESYRDVQLAVPGDWTWIEGTQRTSQWCIAESHPTGVGRPGSSTLAGCNPGEDGVDPGTRIAINGAFVVFDSSKFAEAGTTGDRTTVILGAGAAQVQAERELRDRILATLHRIAVDASGCPVRDDVTARTVPGDRPGRPDRRPVGGGVPVRHVPASDVRTRSWFDR